MEYDISGYQHWRDFLMLIKDLLFVGGQIWRGDWIIETWLDFDFWSVTYFQVMHVNIW